MLLQISLFCTNLILLNSHTANLDYRFILNVLCICCILGKLIIEKRMNYLFKNQTLNSIGFCLFQVISIENSLLYTELISFNFVLVIGSVVKINPVSKLGMILKCLTIIFFCSRNFFVENYSNLAVLPIKFSVCGFCLCCLLIAHGVLKLPRFLNSNQPRQSEEDFSNVN